MEQRPPLIFSLDGWIGSFHLLVGLGLIRMMWGPSPIIGGFEAVVGVGVIFRYKPLLMLSVVSGVAAIIIALASFVSMLSVDMTSGQSYSPILFCASGVLALGMSVVGFYPLWRHRIRTAPPCRPEQVP